jgi:hypothetical protein
MFKLISLPLVQPSEKGVFMLNAKLCSEVLTEVLLKTIKHRSISVSARTSERDNKVV